MIGNNKTSFLIIGQYLFNTIGNPNPLTMKKLVAKYPASSTPLISSSLTICLQIALGIGANIYVRTTSNGSQLLSRAHERIIAKIPEASRKASPIIVFIPAAILERENETFYGQN
jgi:hypothetical protein